MAKDLEEMKHDLKEEVKERLGEYNEKWIQQVQVLEDNLAEEVMTTGIFKTVYRRIKKLSQEIKDKFKEFYNALNGITPETMTEDQKKYALEILLEIPKIMLSSEDDESFIKAIGDLEVRKQKKSIEIESTDNGLLVRDNGHTESILGKQYTLHIEKDEDTNKLVEIKPVISVIMNPALFKTYIVHSDRNGIALFDKCTVVAESEDKASDYVVFVCRKLELIKKNDVIKTDVFLDEKQVAGFICKI